MNPLGQFTPKRELSAQQNLKRFIIQARDHLTIWSDLEGFAWDAGRWPSTYAGVRFTNLTHCKLHPRKPLEPHHMMHPGFVDVAKAYLRYRHTLRPHKNIGREMQALRAIEFALLQEMKVPDITRFSQRHWDSAVIALKPLSGRQNTCDEMLAILRELADLFILTVDPRFWRNPYVGRHSYDAIRGERAPNAVKLKRIPDQDALLAIAEVFSRGANETQEDVDVIVTCITGLLISAPMRIGETLRFRTNCLRYETDKKGEKQYYLAYWVPKTKQFARKPIPRAIIDITKEAITRISTITEEGRRLALYMETCPNKFYRHADCPNVADDQELTVNQVVQALGFSSAQSCAAFMKSCTGSYSLKGYTLDSLWVLVLEKHRVLNPYFPYQEYPDTSTQPPLKMSESLLCFRRYQLAPSLCTSPVLLAPFNSIYYGGQLMPHDESRNFFVRHGYKNLKLKSHSLRHLLNRLGRASGVTLDILTEWSSRATSKQTRTYLHDDPAQAAVRGAVLLGTFQKQSPKKPIYQEESELYRQGPYHRSRYGVCCRSWRAGPCNKFADCLNCSELLMCKGDKIAAEIIATDRNNLSETYTAALQAIENGERAASRWTEMAGPQIERLDQLLAILNDPQIPDGSPIQIAGEDFSHEKTIVSEKAKAARVQLMDKRELGLTYGEELLACLNLLRMPDHA